MVSTQQMQSAQCPVHSAQSVVVYSYVHGKHLKQCRHEQGQAGVAGGTVEGCQRARRRRTHAQGPRLQRLGVGARLVRGRRSTRETREVACVYTLPWW